MVISLDYSWPWINWAVMYFKTLMNLKCLVIKSNTTGYLLMYLCSKVIISILNWLMAVKYSKPVGSPIANAIHNTIIYNLVGI